MISKEFPGFETGKIYQTVKQAAHFSSWICLFDFFKTGKYCWSWPPSVQFSIHQFSTKKFKGYRWWAIIVSWKLNWMLILENGEIPVVWILVDKVIQLRPRLLQLVNYIDGSQRSYWCYQESSKIFEENIHLKYWFEIDLGQ